MSAHVISRQFQLLALALLFAAAAFCWTPGSMAAQSDQSTASSQSIATAGRGIKLFLKDGTYHVVREYKIEGNRVRYYSLERSAWEELPTDIVDWDATRRAEATEAKENAALVEKVHQDEAARNAVPVDIDASVEVAAGTFLPEGEGLFLLDHLTVTLLKQPDTDITFNKTQLLKQVLVPVPIVPTRHTVSILGSHAKLRFTNGSPEFYRRRRDGKEPEIYLVRARIHGDKREIENIDTLFNIDVAKRHTISIEKWELVTGVYRLTLSQPLPPGEYAFTEVANPDESALYVWDFAVDPNPSKK